MASPGRSLQATVRLSEQYLFWAAKMSVPDPIPNAQGSFLYSAAEALAKAGVCDERLWPYSRDVIPANVSQQNIPVGSPSSEANKNAQLYKYQPSIVARATGSAFVLEAIQTRCRPVAISVPVFTDPANSERDNWMTPLGVQYGVVVDPPAGSSSRKGHSVCVTGFISDPSEPRGGYFIFRNSWGTDWATEAPAAGYHSPEPGYGQISASYVDSYLWEVCGL